MERHHAQKRESGEAYFSHPLEVAGILARYRLDSATIATGLLHDTIEDGVATEEEIRREFGTEVSKLVDGVTKLSKIEPRAAATRGDLGKFVLAMSKDVRVLLVKLADRLHNMRTLQHIQRPERRQRIARETLDLYAPLARRVGIMAICEELEDLAFAELQPAEHDAICRRLEFLKKRYPSQVGRTLNELRRVLEASGIESEVTGREKRPHSIWQKMQRKRVTTEKVTDLFAFRVVTPSEEECYRTLSVVHRQWRFVPGSFRDYISLPKPNGYRSLHTTVIGPHKRAIEIQIRTKDMHQVAEYGLAAHWQYKSQGSGPEQLSPDTLQWLRGLREIFESATHHSEGIEDTKLEIYNDLVFCFTPKGDVISLPERATPVDFAYAVHSRVGATCVGCKINDRPAPLDTPLQSGDQVEILRSRSQQPSAVWETFVRTGRARSQIRKSLRRSREREHLKLGKAIIEHEFEMAGEKFVPKTLSPVLKVFGYKTQRELFTAIGAGQLEGAKVVRAIHPKAHRKFAAKTRKGRPVKGAAVGIKGLKPGIAVHLATCCSPLPGERIVGIMTEGLGARVHTIDCETLERFSGDPERWYDLSWAEGDNLPGQIGRLRVKLTNRPGSLNALAAGIARTGANIANLRVQRRSVDFFDLDVDVEVENIRHLNEILVALEASAEIYKAERVTKR